MKHEKIAITKISMLNILQITLNFHKNSYF